MGTTGLNPICVRLCMIRGALFVDTLARHCCSSEERMMLEKALRTIARRNEIRGVGASSLLEGQVQTEAGNIRAAT